MPHESNVSGMSDVWREQALLLLTEVARANPTVSIATIVYLASNGQRISDQALLKGLQKRLDQRRTP